MDGGAIGLVTPENFAALERLGEEIIKNNQKMLDTLCHLLVK